MNSWTKFYRWKTSITRFLRIDTHISLNKKTTYHKKIAEEQSWLRLVNVRVLDNNLVNEIVTSNFSHVRISNAYKNLGESYGLGNRLLLSARFK